MFKLLLVLLVRLMSMRMPRTVRRLQFPDAPCLNVGTPRKEVWIPAEVA